MKKTRVAVQGATGYSALELLKILLRHPHVEITAVTSRQEGSPPIASVHPSLGGRLSLRLEDLGPAAVGGRAECVFSCLPHGVTAHQVPEMLAAGARVVDFSADYRLKDPTVYEKWYGEKHADPARLPEAVYGLPELFRDQIPPARLIANPGCYPTSAALPLAPLLKMGVIEPTGIIIDSKSGVSGAGRTPKLPYHYPECNESFSAYGVGKHRHTPEIEQTLTTFSGQETSIIFTPHLVPMDRGILSTIYSVPTSKVTDQEVLDVLREFYRDEPFVRVVDHFPTTKDTAHSNFCDITARVVRDRIITISTEDNLIKGAAGQAVQNFNLMFGYPETMGIL
ncbi:MAG: N-acetyl-gamma-glutamyl-phosphate reductase [Planctomycetales bacterium]|nr:N-acetyl-gamma-glutamyl-phosphate reductase [Planctomycetales bacterium]